MANIDQTRIILRALAVALVCVVFAGCQSFDFGSANTSETAATVAQPNVIGQYQMQLIPGFGKPTVEKVDITGPMTVQDALEASGAIRKFRGMKITLSRIIKDKGTLLKLPVEYQVRSKTVRTEQNYEVLPGDTITVSPKKNSLDKAIGSISGGLR